MGSTFESITFPAATNLFWPLSGLFNSVFRLFKCQLLTGWDCHLDPCCFGLRQQPPDMGKTISDRLSYLGSCSIFSFKCYGTTLKWANLKYKEWRIAELTIQNPPTHNVFPLDKKKVIQNKENSYKYKTWRKLFETIQLWLDIIYAGVQLKYRSKKCCAQAQHRRTYRYVRKRRRIRDVQHLL